VVNSGDDEAMLLTNRDGICGVARKKIKDVGHLEENKGLNRCLKPSDDVHAILFFIF
jgi:hypothetical protein